MKSKILEYMFGVNGDVFPPALNERDVIIGNGLSSLKSMNVY